MKKSYISSPLSSPALFLQMYPDKKDNKHKLGITAPRLGELNTGVYNINSIKRESPAA